MSAGRRRGEHNDDFVKVSGTVHSGFKSYVVDSDRWEAVTGPFTVDLVLVNMWSNAATTRLLLTGRRLCCCEGMASGARNEGIVYERPLELPELIDEQRRADAGLPIRVANAAATQIREAVVRSRNDEAHRHPRPVGLAKRTHRRRGRPVLRRGRRNAGREPSAPAVALPRAVSGMSR